MYFDTSRSALLTRSRALLMFLFRWAAGFFWANSFLHCVGAGLRWWFSAWHWWQSPSQKWRNACEFSRFHVHCYFAASLCDSAARPQESNGILGDKGNAQLLFRVARCHRSRSNDDLVFPDSGAATALRSELSLSLPGFERDLYHDARNSCIKGKNKRAAHHRRAPHHRGNRTRFNELIPLAIRGCLLPLILLTPRFSEVRIALVRGSRKEYMSVQGAQLPYNDPA